MRPIFGNETGCLCATLSSPIDVERPMADLAHTSNAELGDEFERAFPNSRVSHVLTVRSQDQLGATIEILQLLHASGAQLLTMSLARFDGAFDQRMTLTGLGAPQARRLAQCVAGAPGVQSARVEHQIRRPI